MPTFETAIRLRKVATPFFHVTGLIQSQNTGVNSFVKVLEKGGKDRMRMVLFSEAVISSSTISIISIVQEFLGDKFILK